MIFLFCEPFVSIDLLIIAQKHVWRHPVSRVSYQNASILLPSFSEMIRKAEIEKKKQIRMREDISQNRQRWPLSPFFFSFLFFPRFPFFLFLLADLRKQRHGSTISSRKPIVWNSKRDANFISFPHIFFQFPYPKDVWRLDFFATCTGVMVKFL